jgi:hypothetical protein
MVKKGIDKILDAIGWDEPLQLVMNKELHELTMKWMERMGNANMDVRIGLAMMCAALDWEINNLTSTFESAYKEVHAK